MYESHFGLKRRPFAATPDPRCFLVSGAMQPALDELVVCVEQGQGVAVVSAAAGTGKTLLCERLRQELNERFETVYLGHGRFLTRRAILQTILCELNHSYRRHDEQELRLELIPAIRALSPQRDALVLICDEAHELSEDLLEELRILSDLAEAGRPLVRLVLVGQHGLEETLTLPSLAALNQRIRAHITLDTLDRASSRDYIDYRLTWAGGRTSEVFEPAALELICQASDGVPRCINQLCDHALLLAYVAEQKPVTAETIHDALHDLRQLPLHWNEISRVEPSTPSTGSRSETVVRPEADPLGVLEKPSVDDTTNVPTGEMLSFEFGADEPIGSHPTNAGKSVSTKTPIQSTEPDDNADNVGDAVVSPRTVSSWIDDARKSQVNILKDELIGELPTVVSVEPANTTIRQTCSTTDALTSGTFVEEVVWDRYTAIDAGFEPTDAPQTEATGSISNPSDIESLTEVRATEPTTSVSVSDVASCIRSNETIEPRDCDEVEERFRSVCDRLDQLLRHRADHLAAEESNTVDVAAANLDSSAAPHDDFGDGLDEGHSSHLTEEGIAADVSEMVHDLRSEFGRDPDDVILAYDRLDESLGIDNEIPCDDSEATIELAADELVEVGVTTLESNATFDSSSTHEPNSTHEFGAAVDATRDEQTKSRPYRNLFTLLRRKQQGLA